MTIHRLVAAAALGGALVLGLAACGSSSNTGAAPASQQASPPSSDRRGGPAAAGTVAALAASNIEVQGTSGQVTVNFSGDTTFTDREAGALADVTPGSCVLVTGTGQPVLARNVEISTPSANGCMAGFGGGFGGGGARPQNGGGSPRTGGSRPPRPSGANAARPVAGKVTAVTGTGFTVQEDNRQTGATSDTQVTVDANTTYGKTVAANSGALKVGECVTATGQTDDTGAVTARNISITQPGPSGCVTGGRQGGGFGNTNPNGGGNGNG